MSVDDNTYIYIYIYIYIHSLKGAADVFCIPNDCLGYSTKPSDGEALVLEHSRMWGTPSWPLLPGPH